MHHGATSAFHIEQRASRRLLSIDGLRHFRSYLHWLRKWGYRAPAEAVPVRKVAKGVRGRNVLLLAGTLYCGGSGGVGVEGVAGATVQEAGQAVVVTEGGGTDL